MALLNTTIIPPDKDLVPDQKDVTPQKHLSDLIDGDNILMVILGKSVSCVDGANYAAGVSNASNDEFIRRVLWIKDHVILKDKLKVFLKEYIEKGIPYEEIKAFCLTRSTRKAKSIVENKNKKNMRLGFAGVLLLYNEAEQK